MFQNVVAIVSGGASGLGAATASYLVRHGARVIVADLPRARENFLTLRESLATSSRGGGGAGSDCVGGGSIEFAPADVTSEGEISSALDMAEEAFGEHGEHVRPHTHPARPPGGLSSRR